MARKKTPLVTTPKRPPTLRAAAVGYAGSGGRPLAARRDVRASAPLAPPAADATVLQPMTAPARPSAADQADQAATDTKLSRLPARVLVIGWHLAAVRLLSARCRVSVVETRHDAPAGSATFSDRVIVGDPETLNLNAALDGAQFEAIVVVRLLEHVRDPVAMLAVLRKHLSADGGILAAVPNVMHGRIRLGFLAGRSLAGLLSPDTASPSHWYDSAALQCTFERAGFVITRIDRHLEAFDADAPPMNGTSLPPALVDDLTRDADAMTRTFVAAAHPFPLAGPVRSESRVR